MTLELSANRFFAGFCQKITIAYNYSALADVTGCAPLKVIGACLQMGANAIGKQNSNGILQQWTLIQVNYIFNSIKVNFIVSEIRHKDVMKRLS